MTQDKISLTFLWLFKGLSVLLGCCVCRKQHTWVSWEFDVCLGPKRCQTMLWCHKLYSYSHSSGCLWRPLQWIGLQLVTSQDCLVSFQSQQALKSPLTSMFNSCGFWIPSYLSSGSTGPCYTPCPLCVYCLADVRFFLQLTLEARPSHHCYYLLASRNIYWLLWNLTLWNDSSEMLRSLNSNFSQFLIS